MASSTNGRRSGRRMMTALLGNTIHDVRVSPQFLKCAAVGGQRTCPMNTDSPQKTNRSDRGSDCAKRPAAASTAASVLKTRAGEESHSVIQSVAGGTSKLLK